MEIRGYIVDVVRREIYTGIIVVNGNRISQITPCKLPKSKKPYPYLMPGFIDSHVHIESSMLEPHEFARIAVSHGTIEPISH